VSPHVRHVLATVLLVAGGSLQVIAVLGLAVMRDFLDRLHYVGLAGWGALLVGASILARQSFSLIGDKALATGALLTLLGPLLVHGTARSLRIRAQGDWRHGIERHVEGIERCREEPRS
jgi:multisubunit Na+/H+ antiporter MnhG subunit